MPNLHENFAFIELSEAQTRQYIDADSAWRALASADLAAAEVRRCADKGAYAVCFSEGPAALGLPSVHSDAWDPLWAACEESDTVVNMHVGSSLTFPMTSKTLAEPYYIFKHLFGTKVVCFRAEGIVDPASAQSDQAREHLGMPGAAPQHVANLRHDTPRAVRARHAAGRRRSCRGSSAG